MNKSKVYRRVLELDKNRCVICGSTMGLHIHHVIFRSQGGKTSIDNLMTLCYRCHAIVHSDKLYIFKVLSKLRGLELFRWEGAYQYYKRRVKS